MKNLKNLKELENLLEGTIRLGEKDGVNLWEIYKIVPPLTSLGQDVLDLKKPQLLTLLDKASWAINSMYERYETLEKINEQIRNLNEGYFILSEKLAAYQKPFAEKGKKFRAGRQEGAVSAETKHIQDLVKQNPKMKAKELLALADNEIIDKDMPLGTFKNKVTKAKTHSK